MFYVLAYIECLNEWLPCPRTFATFNEALGYANAQPTLHTVAQLGRC